jgi:hypothetical protein
MVAKSDMIQINALMGDLVAIFKRFIKLNGYLQSKTD